MIQPNNYTCGIYAIVNLTGKSPEIVSQYTDTTREGTTEEGIINCLIKLGYKPKEYRSNNPNNAYRWLKRNNSVILVDKWDHWIAIKNNTVYDSIEGNNPLTRDILEKWSYRGYYGIRL